ncbi:hypothetical protein ACNKHV_06455 [Shigella flexneri]
MMTMYTTSEEAIVNAARAKSLADNPGIRREDANGPANSSMPKNSFAEAPKHHSVAASSFLPTKKKKC